MTVYDYTAIAVAVTILAWGAVFLLNMGFGDDSWSFTAVHRLAVLCTTVAVGLVMWVTVKEWAAS